MPEDNQTESTSDTASPIAAPPAAEAPTSDAPTGDAPKSANLPPLTAERAIDITLGAMSILAEATGKKARELSEQAKTLREDGPAILDAYEERGRPLREQLLGKIREGFAPIPDEGDNDGAASRTAEQDIQALEQRVRELEAEVTVTDASDIPVEEPTVPPIAAVPPIVATMDDETPAEEATFVPHQEQDIALADSPYAVSETEEEAGHESDLPPATISEEEIGDIPKE